MSTTVSNFSRASFNTFDVDVKFDHVWAKSADVSLAGDVSESRCIELRERPSQVRQAAWVVEFKVERALERAAMEGEDDEIVVVEVEKWW